MKQTDRDAIAELYVENTYPRTSNGDTFDDNVYTNIRNIVYGMEGNSMQDVVDAISKKLDIRIQNLDSKLQDIFIKLYNKVNPHTEF